MEKGRTAILYFAYRPDAEAVRKPIFSAHGHKVNLRFYQELQDELFEKLGPLGLPVVHVDDRLQQGDSFAERLCHAVELVWDKGYDQVLILGNDIPELNTGVFQRALDIMAQGDTCLIKTHRGGAGLIGVQRKRYSRENWLEIQWQSMYAFDDLFDCLASCRVIDVDAIELNSLTDLYAFLEVHRGRNSVAFLIESILNPLRNFVSLDVKNKESDFYQTRKLRGPPFKC